MDAFEDRFWDLTTTAAWALTRERDALRAAANPGKEDALHEVMKGFPSRWREANERLWAESGWPRPNDPHDARFFPIADYFLSLFRAGQIKTWGLAPGDKRSREIEPVDWASLKLEGGWSQRLFPQRRGEPDEAFRDIRVAREQVLAVFPPLEAVPVPMPPRPAPEGHGKRAAVIAWLRRRFPSGRPLGRKNPDLQRMFEKEGGVSMHQNTFGQAVRDTWRR
jgi:hypothetical protein